MSMGGVLGKFMAADAEVGLAVKVYHRVNLALLGATPVALATDNTSCPSPWTWVWQSCSRSTATSA